MRMALLEDLGRAGDLTTDTIVPADATDELRLVARQDGVLAGLDLARLAFTLMDGQMQFEVSCADGTLLAPGTEDRAHPWQKPGHSYGGAHGTQLPLPSERRGLGHAFDCRSHQAFRHACDLHAQDHARPAFALQKYAVRVGGGSNHRFGLDDAVLIKDNHIALAGDLATAVGRARAGVGHMVKIELEVDTLAQLDVALQLGVDVVLLDNMSLDDLRTAVAIVQGPGHHRSPLRPHQPRNRTGCGSHGRGPDRRGLAHA